MVEGLVSVDLLFSLFLKSVTKSLASEGSVAKVLSLEHCNVWSSVKSNRPSVNKYANLTRHSSSLLDLDSDSRMSNDWDCHIGAEVGDKPMCSE